MGPERVRVGVRDLERGNATDGEPGAGEDACLRTADVAAPPMELLM